VAEPAVAIRTTRPGPTTSLRADLNATNRTSRDEQAFPETPTSWWIHDAGVDYMSRSLQPRTPAGVILAMYVAERLEDLDDYLRRAQSIGPDQFASNARRDLATLREEMTRRGWA
jgi:hypothetical protein